MSTRRGKARRKVEGREGGKEKDVLLARQLLRHLSRLESALPPLELDVAQRHVQVGVEESVLDCPGKAAREQERCKEGRKGKTHLAPASAPVQSSLWAPLPLRSLRRRLQNTKKG